MYYSLGVGLHKLEVLDDVLHNGSLGVPLINRVFRLRLHLDEILVGLALTTLEVVLVELVLALLVGVVELLEHCLHLLQLLVLLFLLHLFFLFLHLDLGSLGGQLLIGRLLDFRLLLRRHG